MTGFKLLQEHFPLQNNRARLELLEAYHYQLLLPIALNKEIWEFTLCDINKEADFRQYFDTALMEKDKGESYPFAVFDKLNNCYAGSTRLGNIDPAHKKLEIGWTWYHPALQGSGINKACKSLLLNFGFDILDLNRIEIKTSLKNLKSQAAILKIGATKEGILRNHLIQENGMVRDSVIFSFIKEEWPAVRKRIFKEND